MNHLPRDRLGKSLSVEVHHKDAVAILIAGRGGMPDLGWFELSLSPSRGTPPETRPNEEERSGGSTNSWWIHTYHFFLQDVAARGAYRIGVGRPFEIDFTGR